MREINVLTCNLGHKKNEKMNIENLTAQIEFFRCLKESINVALIKNSSSIYIPQSINLQREIKRIIGGKKNCYFQTEGSIFNSTGLQTVGLDTIYHSKESLQNGGKIIYSYEPAYVTFNADFSNLTNDQMLTQLNSLLGIAQSEFNNKRPSIIGISLDKSIYSLPNEFYETLDKSIFEFILPSNNHYSHEGFIISPGFDVIESKCILPDNPNFFNHNISDRPTIIRARVHSKN